MFTGAARDRVRDRVLELAASDPRIPSAAIVGSLAQGSGDEWSDIDLTFGIAEGVPLADVLEDFTHAMAEELEAVKLLDLESGGTTYRVFLLPEWLQVDLSFTPAPDVRQGSPKFKLVFGTHKFDAPPPQPAEDLFGWAVLYARHARVCIERRNWWQAEHHLSALRDHALALACFRRGLPTDYGRGFDQLPADVLGGFEDALVRSLDREELLRALASAVAGLLREAVEVGELAARVEPQLRELASASV